MQNQININGRNITYKIKPEDQEKQTLLTAFQIEVFKEAQKYRKTHVLVDESTGFTSFKSYVKAQGWMSKMITTKSIQEIEQSVLKIKK